MKKLLPKKFVDKINNCGATRIQKEKLIKLCEVMLYHIDKNDDELVTLSQEYLKKVFKCKKTSQNLLYMDIAKKIKLIQPVPYGMNKKGEPINYSKVAGLSNRFSFVDKDYLADFSKIEIAETEKQSDIVNLLKKLVINENALIKKLPEWANKKTNEIKVIHDDATKYFDQISLFGRKYSMSYKKAKAIADKNNFQILKDGEKYILDDFENYKNLKRKRNYNFNFYNIKKLSAGCFTEPSRNCRNQRLDYIITNISKELLTEVLLQNNKIELDLSCSQYTLFANLILFIFRLNMNNSFKNVFLPVGRKTFLNDSFRSESSNHVYTQFEDSDNTDYFEDYKDSNSIINSDYSINNHYSLKTYKANISCHYVLPFLMNPLFLGILERFKNTLESYFSSPAFSRVNCKNKPCRVLPFLEEIESLADLCSNDKLYSSLSKDRSAAKLCMMEVFFSSHKNQSSEKKRMKDIRPQLIAFIDYYKKHNGEEYVKKSPSKKRHGCFPVALQQLESVFFIDTLLPTLREKGLFALPKHDSLIVDADKRAEAREIIQSIMDGIGFRYHLKPAPETKERIQAETIESLNLCEVFDEKELSEGHALSSNGVYEQKTQAEIFYDCASNDLADELQMVQLGFQLNGDGKWFLPLRKKGQHMNVK